MTITNEPTTSEVPAWLNLDEIMRPEQRAEVRAEVETMTAFLTELRDRVARYHRVLEDVQECIDRANVPDGLYVEVRAFTGLQDLEDVGWIGAEMFGPDPASSRDRTQVFDAATRLGLGRRGRRCLRQLRRRGAFVTRGQLWEEAVRLEEPHYEEGFRPITDHDTLEEAKAHTIAYARKNTTSRS